MREVLTSRGRCSPHEGGAHLTRELLISRGRFSPHEGGAHLMREVLTSRGRCSPPVLYIRMFTTFLLQVVWTM